MSLKQQWLSDPHSNRSFTETPLNTILFVSLFFNSLLITYIENNNNIFC